MRQGATGAVAMFAGVLVVTGGIGWLLYQAGDDAAPASAPPTPPKPSHVDRNRLVPPQPDPSDAGGPIPPNMRAKPVPPDAAPRIPMPDHDDLKMRNWKDIAAAVDDMRSVSREMMEKGAPRPDDSERLDAIQRRMQHFMSAVVMRPNGLDVTRQPTQAQHPAFAVNLVASVLERASLPLTDAQTHRLADLAKERGPPCDAADDELKKDDPSQWMLRRYAARAALADGFYAEMFAVLTPAQTEAVSPADLRGRLKLDVVSSAGSWGRIARPLIFSNEKQLIESLTIGLANQFGVVDRIGEVRPIVEAWVHEGGFDAADLLDSKGFTRVAHVPAAVPRTIDLLTRVLDGLKLPPEAVEVAHATILAYVPLRQ